MTCAVDEAVLCASHQAEKEIQWVKFRRPVGEEGDRAQRSRRHVDGLFFKLMVPCIMNQC